MKEYLEALTSENERDRGPSYIHLSEYHQDEVGEALISAFFSESSFHNFSVAVHMILPRWICKFAARVEMDGYWKFSEKETIAILFQCNLIVLPFEKYLWDWLNSDNPFVALAALHYGSMIQSEEILTISSKIFEKLDSISDEEIRDNIRWGTHLHFKEIRTIIEKRLDWWDE